MASTATVTAAAIGRPIPSGYGAISVSVSTSRPRYCPQFSHTWCGRTGLWQ